MPYIEDLIEMSEVAALLGAQEELRSLGHRIVYDGEGVSTNVAGIFIPREKLRKRATEKGARDGMVRHQDR